jgi:hypothetical protein
LDFFSLCPLRYALCDLLAGEDFIGPDLVLEGIVSVCLFDAESCIAVA